MSSPNLNVIFIVGIILVYLLVISFGIDSNLVPTWVFSGLCQTTLWLGVIAFTLVYGSILAQTFRVFYILRNIKVAQNKGKIKVVHSYLEIHNMRIGETLPARHVVDNPVIRNISISDQILSSHYEEDNVTITGDDFIHMTGV